ncbi:ArsC/Spx/MgsR family protein [Neptunicoccus cionae]|uniref:Arsenate reductase n=1 Tax=Neptunicoccus cionae TaxID=2035344 RepID=A0A916VRA3_9RHOB|nr:ArsC/Spx/MgsR family protein [Amylibacter cionae]GGA24939.1 hypothetical protein GCM10011498_27460 [Amylibacter cionae]
MKLYGLKNCDTCRKALKSLADAGHDVSFIDVRAEGVSREDLSRFYTAFGDDLVNTRSTTWRGLDTEERARPSLDLLGDHPTLMKRPVIETGSELSLGWGKPVQEKFL